MNHKVKTVDFENVTNLSDLVGFEAYPADNSTFGMLLDTRSHGENHEIHRKVGHGNSVERIQRPAGGDGTNDTQLAQLFQGIEIDTGKRSIRTQQRTVEIHDKQTERLFTARRFA